MVQDVAHVGYSLQNTEISLIYTSSKLLSALGSNVCKMSISLFYLLSLIICHNTKTGCILQNRIFYFSYSLSNNPNVQLHMYPGLCISMHIIIYFIIFMRIYLQGPMALTGQHNQTISYCP